MAFFKKKMEAIRSCITFFTEPSREQHQRSRRDSLEISIPSFPLLFYSASSSFYFVVYKRLLSSLLFEVLTLK